MTARHRWLALGPVVLAVGALTALRVVLRASGPDLDSDSYGHAVVGRMLLRNLTGLSQHWVWLPLWHYVHALHAWLGAGLELVRLENILWSAASPVLLTLLMLRSGGRTPGRDASPLTLVTAATAGVLACLWPLALDQGQSGQEEPAFTALVLGTCLAWEARRPIAAGAFLSAACLLRYEGWVLLPVFLGLWLARNRSPQNPRLRDAAAWLLPGTAVLTWIALHYRETGELLQFVRLNHEFVKDALATAPNHSFGAQHSALWYPLLLPRKNLGLALWLLLPGLPRFLLTAPRSVSLVGTTLLTFVSYSWWRGEHLGLDRHLFAVVPFYSAAVANGPAAVADLLERFRPNLQRRAPVVLAMALSVLAVVHTARHRTRPAFFDAQARHRAAYRDERSVAELIARQAGMVMCDLPVIEVLSGLPPGRFLRWSPDATEAARLLAAARRAGAVLIVSTPERLSRLISAADTTLYYSKRTLVIRIDAPRGSTASG